MDAISYLLGRNKRPAFHYGLGGVAVAGVSAGGMFMAAETLGQSGMTTLIFTLLGVTIFLCALGCLVAGPYFAVGGAYSAFKGWQSKRLLDEFTSTSLNERYLVKRVFLYHWKNFMLTSGPMALSIVLFTATMEPGAWYMLALYLLGITALIAGAIGRAAWEIAGGWKGFLVLLLGVSAASAPWLCIALVEAATLWPPHGRNHFSYTLLCYLGFLTWMGLRAARTALERRTDFDNFLHSWSQKFALKRRGGSPTSDNAVVAREQMLGSKWSSLATFAFLGLVGGMCFLGSLSERSLDGVVWGVFLLAIFSFGQASIRLSQVLNDEHQRSTLETLRSTPFGSDRFLHGWLKVAIPPLLLQNLFLATPAFLAIGAIQDLHSKSIYALVCAWIVALLAPIGGGLVGLSIAAQIQPTTALRQQLGVCYLALGGVMIVELGWLIYGPGNAFVAIAFNLVSSCLVAATLLAGSRRSLARFFLPQD